MSSPPAEAGYPWHFKLLIGLAGLYLVLRLGDLVVRFVRWIG